jgi:predicted RNA binding protein YcfA (HicA-like mRNA interferase family)
MPKLPRITGTEAVRAFEKAGFVLDRIRGSHHYLKREGSPIRLSIPCHAGRTVGAGLLSRQIKDAGMTVEEFIS